MEMFSVQWTHEREHEIALATISGSTVFATALLTTLGKRTGDRIADQIKERYQDRSRGGTETVVNIGGGETMEFTADKLVHRDVLAYVLKEANEKGSKIVIEFP